MLTFQTGQFHKLKAIADFNFGPLNGITITGGTEMEFDGTTLKMNGASHACPQFALALKAKFVVPVSDQTTTYQPPASQVEVKSATSHGETRAKVSMGTAVEEEKVVGSVGNAADKRASAITAHTEQAQQATPAPAPVPQPIEVAQAPQPKVAAAVPAMPNRPLTVEEADALNAAALAAELNKPVTKGYVGGNLVDKADEDDDAKTTTVGGGKFKVQMADGASQGVVIGQVKSGRNSAFVGTEGEATRKGAIDVTRMTAESVESSLQEQGGTVEGIKNVGAKTAAVQTGIQNVGAQVVSTEEAIRQNPPKPMASTTVVTEGEDIRVVKPGGITGDVSVSTSGEELTELLPDAAVAAPPKKVLAVEEPEISLPGAVAVEAAEKQEWDTDGADAEIAAILAEWDKKRHWQKRVTEAVEMYGDWPEFLEALYEIEAESVVKHIKSRLVKTAAEG
jgi:hypothetical protein